MMLVYAWSDYKLVKIESCYSTDESVVEVETCIITTKIANFTSNIKRPLKKIYVS